MVVILEIGKMCKFFVIIQGKRKQKWAKEYRNKKTVKKKKETNEERPTMMTMTVVIKSFVFGILKITTNFINSIDTNSVVGIEFSTFNNDRYLCSPHITIMSVYETSKHLNYCILCVNNNKNDAQIRRNVCDNKIFSGKCTLISLFLRIHT
ncbi:hypothetical protein RFI_25870 [Reticulomyxa filosa]|uniref:Uncharacterized protein n=1 Tax=Reticulomyxa filosa TaxID=46433 RepID=X6MEN1_RETFI|nr:hypothetical protein RFI_25870 [Reticulomyxa filosa]|eukprot:ETO11505.1 hypothetical protein RFI_25870 [Reticulomyxa filosa]